MTVEQLYERHIKSLTTAEKLKLLALIAEGLAEEIEKRKERNIMELHGLGAEIWQGIDAQAYVEELRKEWGNRPWIAL